MNQSGVDAARERRDDIQALRAIAVLGVVLFHADKNWLPGGFVGVDIFFVISGYLIGRIIWRQRGQGNFSFLAFYASRVRRIVPAYLVMLVLATLGMAVLLTSGDLKDFLKSAAAAFFFLSNLWFQRGGDYFGPEVHEWALLHTWSLAIEMQVYLLLPALLIFLPRRWVGPAVGAISALLLVHAGFRIQGGGQQSVYFSLAARAPEFLLGTLLALYPAGRTWSSRLSDFAAITGVALIAGSFIWITEASPFPGWLALPPCLGAVLLIAAERSRVNLWLSRRSVLTGLGALSYSVYLWHWPLLAALRYLHGQYELPWTALVIFSVLTLVLSYASWRWVETPCRQGRVHPLRVLVVLGGLAVASYAFSAPINREMTPPRGEEGAILDKGQSSCYYRIVAECQQGDETPDQRILLIGDSHANHLNGFADAVGDELNLAFEVISSATCIPIEGFDVSHLAERKRQPCLNQIEEVKRRLPLVQTVVIAGRWNAGRTLNQRTYAALSRFLDAMHAQGKRVLILAQVPELTDHPDRMHRMAHFGFPPKPIQKSRGSWLRTNAEMAAFVAKHPGAQFLDFTSLPVFATVPWLEGKVIYKDIHHLNAYGSREYGEAAVPVMAKALGLR